MSARKRLQAGPCACVRPTNASYIFFQRGHGPDKVLFVGLPIGLRAVSFRPA
jgi:hypothetical protein